MADSKAPVSYDLNVNSAALVAAFDEAIRSMTSYQGSADKTVASTRAIEAAAKQNAREVAKAAKEQERAAKEAERMLAQWEKREQQALAEITKARAAADKEAARIAREEEKRRKAAEKAAADLVAQQAKIEAAAKKAAAATGGSFSEVARALNSSPVISNMEALGSVFITMGGNVSKVAMTFTTLIRPLSVVGTMLSATMGPAAPAVITMAAIPALLLAIPVALKSVATAIMEFGREAVKATEATRGIVDPQITRDLEKLGKSFDTMDRYSQVFTATLGSAMAPAIEYLIHLTMGLAKATMFYVEALGTLTDEASKFVGVDLASAFMNIDRIVRGIATYGLTEVADGLVKVGQNLDDQIQGSLQGYTNKWKEIPPIVRDLKKELDLIEYAEMRRAEKLEEQRKIRKSIDDAIAFAAEDMLTAEVKISAAINARIEAVYELGASEKRTSMAILALKQRETREINKLYDERLEAAFKTLDAEKVAAEKFARETVDIARKMDLETAQWEADLKKEQAEQDAKAQKKEADDLKKRKEAWVDASFDIAKDWSNAIQDIADLAGEAAAQDLKRLEMRDDRTRKALNKAVKEGNDAEAEKLKARLKSINEQETAEREAARKAFNISQQAAVVSVLASSATAFAAMLASLAYLGPGAPVAAAAIVGPSIAAQLAVISQNKPPAHDGAMFGADEFYSGNRTVRSGETAVVFNQRATEQGAAAAAAAMNSPAASPAAAMQRPVQFVLANAGRVIGEAAIAESKRSGSSTRKAFGKAPRGAIDPYRRR